MMETAKGGFAGMNSRQEFAIAFFLVLFVGIFVFKDCLLFNKLYIFKDVGSDTYNLSYPFLVHVADYLRIEGIPQWSFNRGMGQNIFPGGMNDPFYAMLYLLGPEYLAYGIGYIELLKIVLSGVIFYFYLKTLSLSGYTRIAGSVLFAFNGYMLVGGGWYDHSTGVVAGVFLLFAFEKLFKENSWLFFPPAVALLGSYSIFHLYTYGLFLLIYAMFRFIDETGFNIKQFLLLLLKMSLLGILGVAAVSAFILNDIVRMMDSPRVGGEAGYFNSLQATPVFSVGSLEHNLAALFRLFSSDLLGTGSAYRGWFNYLEAPAFYCGLIGLLFVPQLFAFLDKRRKFIFFLFAAIWALAIVFPFLRYSYYLFSGDYYRGGISFVIPVILLFFSLHALDQVDSGRNRIKPILLLATLAALLGMLYYPYFEEGTIHFKWDTRMHLSGSVNIEEMIEAEKNGSMISNELRMLVTVFLCSYAALLYLLNLNKYKKLARVLLLLLICLEAGLFSSITVNNRWVMSPMELKEKTGYNDYTVEAITAIKSKDPGFYRISKDYRSGTAFLLSSNDAQIQDYYGTPTYYSFNQKHYIKFLAEMRVIDGGDERQTRWSPGLGARPFLQTFASIKYSLSKNDAPSLLNFGYRYVAAYGNVKVLKNKYDLPLGFTYDNYLLYNKFRLLSPPQKEAVIFKAAVIDGSQTENMAHLRKFDIAELKNVYTSEQYITDVRERKKEALALTEHSQNQIKGQVELEKKKLLFFSIPFDRGWSAKIDGKEADLKVVNIGFMGLLVDKGVHSVELKFSPPFLFIGALLGILSIIGYAILWYRTRA